MSEPQASTVDTEHTPAIPLVGLAQRWISETSLVGSRSGRSENTTAARIGDLAAWGNALQIVAGTHTDTAGDTTGAATRDTLARALGMLTLDDFTTDNLIDAYMLIAEHKAASTIARRLSTLRTFSRWLYRRGHLGSNPADDDMLTSRAIPQKLVRAYSTSDIEAMRAAAAAQTENNRDIWPARDLAIIELLSLSGLRASEACQLHIGDVTMSNPVIVHVRRHTKSGRQRSIPVPASLRHTIDDYLVERATRESERGELNAGADRELFIHTNGKPFTTDGLAYRVSRIAAAAGVSPPEQAILHGFRHYFGSQLAQAGVPQASIQQLLGHADPRATGIYTTHTGAELVSVLQASGWLDQTGTAAENEQETKRVRQNPSTI